MIGGLMKIQKFLKNECMKYMLTEIDGFTSTVKATEKNMTEHVYNIKHNPK